MSASDRETLSSDLVLLSWGDKVNYLFMLLLVEDQQGWLGCISTPAVLIG